MDAEILATRLAAAEEILLRLDQRIDALQGALTECQIQLSTLPTPEQIAEQIAPELQASVIQAQAEVAVAQAEAQQAEAEAVEALAEARQAEAEAVVAAIHAEATAAEPEAEAAGVEVIEAAEPEEEPERPQKAKTNSDLQRLGFR